MLTAVVTPTTRATSKVIKAIWRARTPSLSQGEEAGCSVTFASTVVARCSSSRALTVVAMTDKNWLGYEALLTVLFYQTGLTIRLQLVMKCFEADAQSLSGSGFIIFGPSERA